MRKLISFCFAICISAIYAEKTPQEVKDSLYATTNLWGQTRGLRKYWAACNAVESRLEKYDDYEEVYYAWRLSLVDFISKIPSPSPEWLQEGGVQIMLVSRTPKIQQSTNCWLSAADCLKRILTMRDDAFSKWQAVEAKTANDFSWDNKLMKEWHDARNKYVNINNSIGTLAWTVTNSFPAAILPTLPAEEGAALYTNVLRRAGLVQ